jgi:hypothetical protein
VVKAILAVFVALLYRHLTSYTWACTEFFVYLGASQQTVYYSVLHVLYLVAIPTYYITHTGNFTLQFASDRYYLPYVIHLGMFT